MNIQAESTRRAGLPVHETVYRRLRDMILFGEMAPGQAVTIQGLVDETGAGMTPVREALRRLTAEGALEAFGNRRIAVPVLRPDCIAELVTARVAVEPILARQAAARIDDEVIAQLAAIDDRLDLAISQGDIRLYLQENHRFHARLNQVAQAPILTAIVDSLWLRFGPSLRVVCGQIGTRSLPDRHKDLVQALQARDPEAAAQAIEEDVVQGMEMIMAGLTAP
ncbi:GntR family transcriptional regulator [Tropicibacter oceani]|uniref:GntR family transcriptional regulator n=1 Tax=Tropicibacter oceani TaxID=3058420 RepID=A0ABY8QHQ1_9RHOB|nr:GntR family transcriptional regulator [Tropicibacter oceani]WGW04174.1 GntR family transcriptional regulator [Tropicibacter oceani]